jgi:pentatricopeptide repeat protein
MRKFSRTVFTHALHRHQCIKSSSVFYSSDYLNTPKYNQASTQHQTINKDIARIGKVARVKQHPDSNDFKKALELAKSLKVPDHYTIVLLYEIAGRQDFETVLSVNEFVDQYKGLMDLKSPYVFSSKLNAYIKTKRFKDAIQLYNDSCTGTNPIVAADTLIYNLVLAAYMQIGRPQDVFRVYDRMVSLNTRPNARTIAMLLEFLIKNDLPDRAIALFNEFCQSNEIIRDSIAPKYNRETDRSAIDTRGVIFNTFLKSMLDKKQNVWNSIAEDLFNTSRRKHLNNVKRGVASNLLVDTVSYNTMLKFYYDSNEYEKAKNLLITASEDARTDPALAPTLHTYNTILDSFIQKRKGYEAFEIFEIMKSDTRITPNIYTYSQLLNACDVLGDIEKAKEILQLVLADKKMIPEISLFSSLMKVFGNYGEVDEALTLMDTIREAGLIPNAWVYVGLFKAFRRKCLFREGWAYFTEHKIADIPDMNIHLASSLSHLIRNSQDMHMFMQVYRRVRSAAKQPKGKVAYQVEEYLQMNSVYNRILKQAWLTDEFDTAVEIFSDIAKTTNISRQEAIAIFHQFLELEALSGYDPLALINFKLDIFSELMEKKYPLSNATTQMIQKLVDAKKKFELNPPKKTTEVLNQNNAL